MVDKVTSGKFEKRIQIVIYPMIKLKIKDEFPILDENVTKDVKESMLQACPDICETGILMPYTKSVVIFVQIVILVRFSRRNSISDQQGVKIKYHIKVGQLL